MNIKGVLIAGAIILLAPIGCGSYMLYSSVVSAPGRVVSKTLETNNIIFNYELFFNMNSSYQSRLSQVKQYAKLISVETDGDEKIRLRTELSAMQQSCRELANKYNAESMKINRSIFKDRGLPSELSSTQCEVQL